MTNMTKVAASILAADWLHLADELRRAEQAGADWAHLDVMDGMFVPNISFGQNMVKLVSGGTAMLSDVHLMIERPERYIEEFAQCGARVITIHAEATHHAQRALSQIRGMGLMAGLSLNPGTSLSSVEYLIDDVDLFLIMTVNPGFGGQKLIPAAMEKVGHLRAMLQRAGSKALIEVDGGVNAQTARQLVQRGADVLVAGSALFGAADPAQVVRELKGL